MIVNRIIKGVVVLSSVYSLAIPTSSFAMEKDSAQGKELAIPQRQAGGKFARMAQDLKKGEASRQEIVIAMDKEVNGFFKEVENYDEINRNLEGMVPQAIQKREEVLQRSFDIIQRANRMMAMIVKSARKSENVALGVILTANDAHELASFLVEYMNTQAAQIQASLKGLLEELELAKEDVEIEQQQMELVKMALKKVVADQM